MLLRWNRLFLYWNLCIPRSTLRCPPIDSLPPSNLTITRMITAMSTPTRIRTITTMGMITRIRTTMIMDRTATATAPGSGA